MRKIPGRSATPDGSKMCKAQPEELRERIKPLLILEKDPGNERALAELAEQRQDIAAAARAYKEAAKA